MRWWFIIDMKNREKTDTDAFSLSVRFFLLIWLMIIIHYYLVRDFRLGVWHTAHICQSERERKESRLNRSSLLLHDFKVIDDENARELYSEIYYFTMYYVGVSTVCVYFDSVNYLQFSKRRWFWFLIYVLWKWHQFDLFFVGFFSYM